MILNIDKLSNKDYKVGDAGVGFFESISSVATKPILFGMGFLYLEDF